MRGAVDLAGIDVKSGDVKILHLSVALSVLEEVKNKLSRLLGPATLGVSPLLALGLATNITRVAGEGNDLLLLQDVVKVSLGADQWHLADGMYGFTRVLVAHTEVRPTSLAGCGEVSCEQDSHARAHSALATKGVT